MKIKYLLLFVAVAMLSGAVNEVSAQSKQSSLSSTEKKTRITPDLAFLNLHGPVKTLKDEKGKIWEFTSEGNLKSLPIGYYRDSEGYIVKQVTWITDDEEIEGFEYIYNHRLQLIEYNGGGPGWIEEAKYFYNPNGLVETMSFYYNDSGSWWKVIVKYTYVQLDGYGNWIKRKWTADVVSGDEEENDEPTNETETGVATRVITYYE